MTQQLEVPPTVSCAGRPSKSVRKIPVALSAYTSPLVRQDSNWLSQQLVFLPQPRVLWGPTLPRRLRKSLTKISLHNRPRVNQSGKELACGCS
jgi:hypothetical protein